MNFDPLNLLLGFAISTVGYALFRWGKKQAKVPHLVGGVLLMVTPYVCPNIPTMLAVCGAIGALAYLVARAGG